MFLSNSRKAVSPELPRSSGQVGCWGVKVLRFNASSPQVFSLHGHMVGLKTEN